MQVSAVSGYNLANSTSFKGRSQEDMDIIRLTEDDYDEFSSSGKSMADKIREAAEMAREAAEYDAQQDVSPITILAGGVSLIGVAGFLKGKVMPPARRLATYAAEYASKAMIFVTEKVAALLKKPLDLNNVQAKISDKLVKIREAAPVEGFKDGILKFPRAIFGEDSKVTNIVSTIIEKFSIKSPIELAEAAGSVAIAYVASDKVSDTTEGKIDGMKIGKRVQKAISECVNAAV